MLCALGHSAGLAQRKLPAQTERRIKGPNDHLLMKGSVRMFGILILKSSNCDVTFLRNAKTAILSQKSEENRTTTKISRDSR